MATCSGTLTVIGNGGNGGGGFQENVTASCMLDDAQTEEGDGVRGDFTVVNNNDQTAQIEATILADGQTIETDAFSVPGNDSLQYQAIIGRNLSQGTYQITMQVTSATPASAFGLRGTGGTRQKSTDGGGCSVCPS